MPQLITSSTSDPAVAPARVGYLWVNTAAGSVWLSVGTAAASDWRKMAEGPAANFSGAGSPEGVVAASPGATYTDTSVDPPPFWTKHTGTGNTGWRQLIG